MVPEAQIVAQVMFVEETDDTVQLDAVVLSINMSLHPSVVGCPLAPSSIPLLTITCTPLADPILRSLLVDQLKRWADDGEVIGVDFVERRGLQVSLRSERSKVLLDLVA